MSGDLPKPAQRVLDNLPGSKHDLAKSLGCAPSTAKDHIQTLREHNVAIEWDHSTGKYHRAENEPYVSAGEIDIDTLANTLQTATHESELVEKFDTTPGELAKAITKVRQSGRNVNVSDGDNPIYHIPQEWDRGFTLDTNSNQLRFGLISDTHLGSATEHLDELHDYYDRAESAGISHVFHCGDISDGWRIHKGHINEIKGNAAGWGRLEDYVVQNYPQRDGITTHFIEGNHDSRLFEQRNIHFGRLLDSRRNDLNYLGNSQATVYLSKQDDITLELIHPSGGKPYTTGYRLQTLYRERNMEDRPTIAGVGHLHGSMYAETEGVKGLYAGAWKGTTTYGKRKGHQAKIGGWILDVTISDGRITEFVPRWQGYSENEDANSVDLETL